MERKNEKFGIVYQKVVSDPELCLQAKGLYALICTYANKERTCFPSINTLADLCDVNPSTIHRNFNVDRGWIRNDSHSLSSIRSSRCATCSSAKTSLVSLFILGISLLW